MLSLAKATSRFASYYSCVASVEQDVNVGGVSRTCQCGGGLKLLPTLETSSTSASHDTKVVGLPHWAPNLPSESSVSFTILLIIKEGKCTFCRAVKYHEKKEVAISKISVSSIADWHAKIDNCASSHRISVKSACSSRRASRNQPKVQIVAASSTPVRQRSEPQRVAPPLLATICRSPTHNGARGLGSHQHGTAAVQMAMQAVAGEWRIQNRLLDPRHS